MWSKGSAASLAGAGARNKVTEVDDLRLAGRDGRVRVVLLEDVIDGEHLIHH
jgi:S-adenosylhomocysteine hydrolase